MSKKVNKRVPGLRFPEFEGDWFLGTLQDCIKKLDAGVSVNSDSQESIKNEKGVLKTSCVSMDKFEPSENKLVIDEYEITRLRESVKKDTIIICRSNTPTFVGASAYIDKDYPNLFLSDKLWAAKIRENHSCRWISYLLLQGKNRTLLCLRATGTSNSMKNISKDDLLTLSAYLPTQKEQEKIASFLGSIDTRLTQLRRKHELLQTYKRGVMQKIFSQAIRFKQEDRSEFPEWRKKKLGDITKIYDGTHQTPDYVKEGVPFYSVEHLTANNFTDTKFISEEVFLQEQRRVSIEKDDILMTRIGDIGTCRLINWDVRASFYVSLALVKSSKIAISGFLVYFMSSIYFQRELYKKTIHVAFPKKINLGEISNCKILVPCIKEQEKIADFLTAIDKKIEAVAEQIDRLDRFKKGLLQKMFV